MDTLVRMRLMVLLMVGVVGLIVWLPVLGRAQDRQPHLEVHFLNVGQGDATLIETPEGIQVLIDGGRDSSVLRELGKVMAVNDRSIDMVVATHPDSDHIGGLIDVLARYEVAAILMTENEGKSEAAAAYTAAVEDENAEVIMARRGQEFQLGASTTLRVLFPDVNPSEMESNASSIILQLSHGEIDFMLTGDAPKSIEEYLVLLEGEHLESEILKVGHHGSRTSTSELFLSEVDPEFGVISAGHDSQYGHPHVEVTDTLFNFGVETFSTAEEGTITFVSNGTKVWLD